MQARSFSGNSGSDFGNSAETLDHSSTLSSNPSEDRRKWCQGSGVIGTSIPETLN